MPHAGSKTVITGHGGASKDHVQWVVRETLGIRGEIREDASDALALALSHMYTEQTQSKLVSIPFG